MKFFVLALSVLAGSVFFTAEAAAASDTKKVVYLYDGESAHGTQVSELLKSELKALSKGRYEAVFLPDQTAGWDPKKAEQLLAKSLKDPGVDLMVVSGVSLTLAVMQNIPLEKPVIVADFVDPGFLGLPRTDQGTSGVTNLSYIAKTKGAGADFAAFRRILRFQTLHVLSDLAYRRYADRVLEKIGKVDFEVKIIPAAGNVAQILAAIDREKIEALYLPPLRVSESDYRELIRELNRRKIPTFSAFGYEDVEKGILGGRIPKLSAKFTRRVAMNADRILSGEDAAALPVEFDLKDRMLINRCTADAIGLSVPFDVLLEAEVLCSEGAAGDEVLTLHQAVREALKNNLNFRIIDEQINIARKDYWLAWTNYLPGADLLVDYGVKDSERARNVPFTPKWSFGYGVAFNQLIFSHPVLFDIANSKKQIKVEDLRRGSQSLDITGETVAAYLAYLSAKGLHKVALDNLKAIEVNLDVAEKRRKTGAGGREEVLRWQSELAEKKTDVLRRESDIYKTRVVLNQLMNRHQERLFREQDVGLETVDFYIGSRYLEPHVRNFKTLLALLEFATEEAMTNSPELQALEIGIEQQKNNVRSADGRFVLPEASISGEAGHALKEKYYQSQEAGDDEWDVNLRMTYPLFDQGRRPIESLKQRNELRRLKFTRDLRQQEIERGLRRAAYNIYASLPSVKLTAEAMSAASENYDIVEKKYNEGIANITELIDAQTNKFNRQARAVVAIYDFLADLSSFDRQLATYYMLAGEEDRQAWLEKLKTYLGQKGVL